MNNVISLVTDKGYKTMDTSPTGVAVLPQWLVKLGIALVGTAGVATQVLPEHTVAYKVSFFVAAVIGPLLGIASQGVRK